MKALLSSEPVLTHALAVVTALIALLVAFGVNLTTVQQAAIGAFFVAVLGLAALVRSKVTPTPPSPPAPAPVTVTPGG